MTGPKESEDTDPLAEFLTALREILAGQAVILRRLNAIDDVPICGSPPPCGHDRQEPARAALTDA